MNKKIVSLFPLIFGITLSSCATGVRHNISEYFVDTTPERVIKYHDDFKILQLTDLHLGDKENRELHFKFMDLTINEANPDMIVVTGDLFTFASKGTAIALFKYLDSKEKPWTVCYGNHDEQCYFSVDWLTNYLNNYGSYCYYKDIQDDDVQGNCNFAINIMNAAGTEIFEQVIIMDSNRYYYGSYFGYDYFKQDQIEWYKNLVAYTKTQPGGATAQSLMFYHIPLPEINDAYENGTLIPDEGKTATDPTNIDVKREKSCPPDTNSGFFDVLKNPALSNTKAMFFGHDHINTFRREYQGVIFNYGIKSTDCIYHDEDLLGGQVITIKNDRSLTFKRIFHTYKEVM